MVLTCFKCFNCVAIAKFEINFDKVKGTLGLVLIDMSLNSHPTMNNSQLPFLILFVFFLTNHNNCTECDYYQQCANATLNINSVQYCGSYKSCANSYWNDTSNAVIGCFGDRSCLDTKMTHSQSFRYMHCYGDQSCAHINNLETRNLGCHGSSSCYNTRVSSQFHNLLTICHGDQSCANSVFNTTSSHNISGYGSYSLMNSIISTNINIDTDSDAVNIDINIIQIELSGYEAGYNLTIECDNEDVFCVVLCYGNACNNTEIYCLTESIGFNDSGNYNCYIDCNDEMSRDCPTVIYTDIIINDTKYDIHSNPNPSLNIENMELIFVDLNEISSNISQVCTGGYNAITCDYLSCANEVITMDWDSTSYGYSYNYSNWELEFNYSTYTDDIKFELALCCWGRQSCSSSTVVLSNSILDTIFDDMDYYDGNYDDNTMLDLSIGIVCSAHESCEDVIVNTLLAASTNQTTVDMDNTQIDESIVINIAVNVYCFALRACSEQIITNNNGDIKNDINITIDNYYLYCDNSHGSNHCYNYTQNTNVNIYCGGYRSCSKAVMYNIDNLYCSGGTESCSGITVFGVQNMFILSSGEDIVHNSYIYSSNMDNTDDNNYITNVFIWASINNDQFENKIDFVCNGTNDICYLECGVNGACNSSYVTFDCSQNTNGICIVYCDEKSGIDCPYSRAVANNSITNVCVINQPLFGGLVGLESYEQLYELTAAANCTKTPEIESVSVPTTGTHNVNSTFSITRTTTSYHGMLSNYTQQKYTIYIFVSLI